MKSSVLGAGIAVFCASLTAGAGSASAETLRHFFDAGNNGYAAYYDTSDRSVDAKGHRLVAVKLTAFSSTFRDWMEKNFPKSHDAAYALDPYSVDCSIRQVAEHRLVFYDANGLPMTQYDFGDTMSVPLPNSMKSYLVKEICGG